MVRDDLCRAAYAARDDKRLLEPPLFFGSVTTIPVSFLRPAAARGLITQPTPDFPLDYNADAIEHIIRLTNGQPYLMQLICRGLVTRFNRQTFEEGLKQPRRFTITDVEAIINAPDFYRDGLHYFAGVWSQAQHHSPTQPAILSALAPSASGLPLDLIAQKSALTPHESQSALQTNNRSLHSHRKILSGVVQ